MKTKLKKLLATIKTWGGTKTATWLIIGLLIVQALWIAFTAAFPQAFDEDFHFGLVQVYSHYWLPFLTSQPPNADAYGAVARDPSFLYHYLLSFPYRLLDIFVHGQVAQVIMLRCINIGFFAGGLYLFYKVLLRAGLSRLATNVSLFILVMFPVAPQLAGQINYDNLLLLLTAWMCLLAFKLVDQFKARKLDVSSLLVLVTAGTFTSLVKYSFLPIFLAIILFLAAYGFRQFRRHWPGWPVIWKSFAEYPRTRLALLVGALLLGLAMFIQRDIVNAVKYHNIAPDCASVLTQRQCSAYPVWLHDYQSNQSVQSGAVVIDNNPIWYLGQWFYWLWFRLFFAINGPYDGFRNYPPLPLPVASFGLLAVFSAVMVVIFGRTIFKRNPKLVLLATITIIYLLILLSQGILKYRETGVLELQNGRYLLPIMVPAMVVAWTAITYGLRKRPWIITAIGVIVVLCFLQGGGVLTYISRSDDKWYWDHPAARHVNNAAREVTSPLLYEGSKYYPGTQWFFN